MISNFKFLSYLIILMIGHVKTDNPISISVEPPSKLMGLGETIKITCAVQHNKFNNSILWMRKTGDLMFGIGVNEFFYTEVNHLFRKRYSLQHSSSSNGGDSYTLVITDSILEDSSTVLCVLSPQNFLNTSVSFAVCTSNGNRYCDCVLAAGWASSDCLISDSSLNVNEDNYRKITIGLGIALAVTIFYTFIIGFIFGKDCIFYMYKDFVEKQKQEKHLIEAYKARKNKLLNKQLNKTMTEEYEEIMLTGAISDTCSDSADTAASSTVTNCHNETVSSGYQGSNSQESSVRELGRRGRKQVAVADDSNTAISSHSLQFYAATQQNYLNSESLNHPYSPPIGSQNFNYFQINNISGLVKENENIITNQNSKIMSAVELNNVMTKKDQNNSHLSNTSINLGTYI